MPKKVLNLKNFRSGLIFSEHGADIPPNAIVGGGNHDVNRDAGTIGLSGGFEDFQTPDPKTDIMEDLAVPNDGYIDIAGQTGANGYLGMRGKGLFYFTSDYDTLKRSIADRGGQWDSKDSESGLNQPNFGYDYDLRGWEPNAEKDRANFRIGSKQHQDDDDLVNGLSIRGFPHPCEYLVFGTLHHRGAFGGGTYNYYEPDDWPGAISSSIHIYQIDRKFNNLIVPDGVCNGYLCDIPMGGVNDTAEAGGSVWETYGYDTTSNADGLLGGFGWQYIDRTNSEYSRGWFPVYYLANGGLRICDGGFLPFNKSKLWIGYVKNDSILSNNIFSDTFQTFVDSNISELFKNDSWVIDRGDSIIQGTLEAPKTGCVQADGQFGGFTTTIPSMSGRPNTVFAMWANQVGLCSTPAPGGDSHPQIGFSGTGNFSEASLGKGCIQLNLWLKTKDSQDWWTSEDSFLLPMDGFITLPQAVGNQVGWRLYVSYVYEGGQESKPSLFGVIDNDPDVQGTYGHDFFDQHYSEHYYGDEKIIECFWQVDIEKAKVNPRIKGARLYIVTPVEIGIRINEDSNYNLVSEMSFEKGSRAAGSISFQPWQESPQTDFDSMVYCVSRSTTLGEETFETLHGYTPEEIKPCYYKTAIVVNNRTYVGNVKFDGRLYPDRMMKSPIGEYDVFTENGFIDVEVDDGDDIVHLESFADRILQFKNNIVHVINISKEYEFLEQSVKFAGVKSPSQVTLSDKGIFWANRNGLFWYNGEQIVNVLAGIGLNVSARTTSTTGDYVDTHAGRWHNIISEVEGEEPILSYDPINKNVIILGNSSLGSNIINSPNTNSRCTNNPEVPTGHWDDYNANIAHVAGSTMRITTTTTVEDEGARLYANNVTHGRGFIELDITKTYFISFKAKHASFSPDPTINVSLGGTVGTIQSVDGTLTDSTITTTDNTYYAVIKPANNTGDLLIYNPASNDAGTITLDDIYIRPVGSPGGDIGFLWNTQYNNLTQLFNKSSESAASDKTYPGYLYGGGKTNTITTVDGNILYIDNSTFSDYPESTVVNDGRFKVWNPDPVDEKNQVNLLLLTKSIDFGNHSQRKVIQSIHFTYSSSTATQLIPYVTAFYLDGTSPATFYLCTSSASGIDSTALNGNNYEGSLPTTSGKYETYKYDKVLSSNISGNAKSMRSELKNVGAIQIGLVKLYAAGTTPSDFKLEEIAIVHRIKSPK